MLTGIMHNMSYEFLGEIKVELDYLLGPRGSMMMFLPGSKSVFGLV